MPPLPTTLDCDAGPYPSDERLNEIPLGDATARWMVDVFPKLAAELKPFGHCMVSDGTGTMREPVKIIEFSTGGWSGCESFIDAVLGNAVIHLTYYAMWRRGGHYTFTVSASQLEEES